MNKMNKHRIYFDMEFTGLHQATTLISMGYISESGKSFYAEFNDYDKTQIDPWLETHVLGNLSMNDVEEYLIPFNGEKEYKIKGNKEQIKIQFEKWLNTFDKIEMWSDCLSYDWILFNNIFGTALNIPEKCILHPI